MPIDYTKPPLFNLHWDEAIRDENTGNGLLIIFAKDLQNQPYVIGTGFIVKRNDYQSICISAAHVFSEFRRLHSSPIRHALSALPEFLPNKKKLNLNGQSLFAICIAGERAETAKVESVAIDEALDIAIFTISLNDKIMEPFFPYELGLDDTIPEIGHMVAILGYGNLSVPEFEHDRKQLKTFSVASRPILRIGRVLAHYPTGHRLCRGPCIETSIPVYSGMSGGPVCHYSLGGTIRAFGVICADPDQDTEQKQDRNIEGRSLVALLPCKLERDEDGDISANLTIDGTDLSGLYSTSK